LKFVYTDFVVISSFVLIYPACTIQGTQITKISTCLACHRVKTGKTLYMCTFVHPSCIQNHYSGH